MQDYFGYSGKVCVVTGSSNGMGLATAKMLVDLGATVYCVSRSDTKIEGIEKSIRCNLSDKVSIDEAFAQLPEHIDCFFGVAGLSGSKTDYLTTFNCDFTANKYITLEYLEKRMTEGGAITYVTSTAGMFWQKYKKEQSPVVYAEGWDATVAALGKLPQIAPANFAYIFAKRCLSQFAAEKAYELGKRGIRVNNVMPGSTDTGMKDEFQKMAGGEDNLLAQTGVAHRLAKPEEMAGPIVFLGSAMASFTSGVDICIDAGCNAMEQMGHKKNQMNIPATNTLILKIAQKAMQKNK
ncbi:MAG: SDR family oxidoreductase [Oscillospiraceae bacterium]|nr:SDR family oxidoreductase [Oscillospiraceae bacterium]